MKHNYFVRAQLIIDKQTEIPPGKAQGIFAPAFLDKWSYTVHIKSNTSKAMPQTFSGAFTDLYSDEHVFQIKGDMSQTGHEANRDFSVTWELFFDGKKRYTRTGELFQYSQASKAAAPQWSPLSVNFTKSVTQLKTDHTVTQPVSAGVGWYLIKKEETFGDLMNRTFKLPSMIDWKAMRENNKHLGDVTSLTILKPGQVVIISKTRGEKNSKLQQMKTEAEAAQKAWKKASEQHKIDAHAMVLYDVLAQGHEIILLPPESISNYDRAHGIELIGDWKPWVDGSLGLASAQFESANKAYESIKKSAQTIDYTTPKGTAKRVVREVANNNPHHIKLLSDSSYARKLIKLDFGIEANKARDYANHAVRVRSARYNGGIPSVAQNLDDVGKYSKALKGLGVIGIACEAGIAGSKAYDAYQHGDTDGAVTEAAKGVGSIAGGVAAGAVASYLLVGVATGGIGLVVIGIASVTAGIFGGKGGEKIGEEAAEFFNDGAKKYYENNLKDSIEGVF
jgi:hypothetical protein